MSVDGNQKCTTSGNLNCTTQNNYTLVLLTSLSGGRVKGVIVYNQIQALLAKGFSQRQISRELGINRRTVKKLSKPSIAEASAYFERGVLRQSGFDAAKEFIVGKIESYPGLRSSNLYHQVCERYPEIGLSERSFRHYVRKLKASLVMPPVRQRYFEPVTDWQPGEYMQVDPGEQSVVMADGSRMKVYFVSFVLCYSRYMYVHYSSRPYNTELFIDAHLGAFQSFSGIPRKGIYDQTKLVALNEMYREVVYNERFQRFFLGFGFRAEVCEGYDPQSKGMVEKSIDYIKGSFIHGREFGGIEDIRRQSEHWLSSVANVREHQTTLCKPTDIWSQERSSLMPLGIGVYVSEQRKVDKTGLISYQGRHYSVPYRFQGEEVSVRAIGKILSISDPASGAVVAEWDTGLHNRKINKNNNHYLDYSQSLFDELELSKVAFRESGIPSSEALLSRLEADNPKHPRQQFRGIRGLLKQYKPEVWASAMEEILSFPVLSCRRIRELLIIKQTAMEQDQLVRQAPPHHSRSFDKNRFRDLGYYDRLINGGSQ